MAAPLRQQRHTHFRDDGSTHVRFIDAPSPNAMRPPSSGPQKPSAEPPPKKPKLREKGAVIDDPGLQELRDEREQLRRRRAERRQRKAAARGLRETLAAAPDAGAAAPPTPRPSLDPALADGAAAAAAALADPPAPATLRAAPSADADADKAWTMDLDAPAATLRGPAGLPGHQAWTTVIDVGRRVPMSIQRQCPRNRREKMMMDLASGASARTDRWEGFETPSSPDACGCCSSGKCTSDDPSPPQQPGLDDEAAAPAPAPARPPVVRDAAAPAPARPAVPSRDAFQDLELWPGATLTSTAASFSEQGFTSLDYVRIARALQGFFPGLGAHQLIYHSSVDALLAAYYPDADAEAAEPLRAEPSTAPTKALDGETDAPVVVPSEYKPGDELTFNDGNDSTIKVVFIRKTSKDVARVEIIEDENGPVKKSDSRARQRYGRPRDGSVPKSRFWNVSWNRSKNKWEAYYTDADGERHQVGYFYDEETAARARDEAVRAARLEGKRTMNVDESGSLVPKSVRGTRSRGRAAAVAPPSPCARPRRSVAKYADEAIDEADGDEADGDEADDEPDDGEVIEVWWKDEPGPEPDGFWRCMVVDDDGSLFVESDQEGFGDPMPFDPKEDSWRRPEEVLDEEDDLVDDEEADNEPHEAEDGIIISILLTDIDGHVSRRDARAARSGETREVYDARLAKQAAARKEGPPPPIRIDKLPPKADPGSSRMGKEATAERPAEQWASYVDEAGQTYYYNTMESDEAKVQDVVKRYYRVIHEQTKKEERSCYFTGDGKVVVKDKEAMAKLFGYESWKAVTAFFSLFEFKRVGGGGRGCPWSVYQHEHFRADGADLHLVQRNDEGKRCSTTGKIRWYCPCGKQNKGFAACGGGICPKSGKPRAYCKLGCEPSEEGKTPCGNAIPRQQLGRLLGEAFSKNHTSREIHKFFGFESQDLRNVLIAGSPYGPSTVQMWHDGLLEVDHIISLRYLRELLGVFVTKDGDKKEPTLWALMASCLLNLQLLLRYLNGLKSDEVTDKTHLGIERRYKVLMRAVEQTDPSGDGRWICPHPTKKMDKVYVNIDIFCKLLKEHVAKFGGEIGCEDLPRY